jgi:hypothetical protein
MLIHLVGMLFFLFVHLTEFFGLLALHAPVQIGHEQLAGGAGKRAVFRLSGTVDYFPGLTGKGFMIRIGGGGAEVDIVLVIDQRKSISKEIFDAALRTAFAMATFDLKDFW